MSVLYVFVPVPHICRIYWDISPYVRFIMFHTDMSVFYRFKLFHPDM